MAKANQNKLVQLVGVKINRRNVYIETGTGMIRVTPNGQPQYPSYVADSLPKSERRKFRKALVAAGFKNIVPETIQPKQMSEKLQRHHTMLDLKSDNYYQD